MMFAWPAKPSIAAAFETGPKSPDENAMLASGASSWTISAIARPSSAPAGSSCRIVTSGAERSPVLSESAAPPPTALNESEMIPTPEASPSAPSARAAGPWMTASPCESTLPVCTTGGVTGRIACVASSAAADGSALAGSDPSTMAPAALSVTAATRMPSARSRRAAASRSPST